MNVEPVRRHVSMLLCAICFLGISTTALAQTKQLGTSEAKDHIGEQATVCGRVASTRYVAEARGKPTFLNLDKPYPNPTFTVLIWGENRAKFGAPEDTYRNGKICATGRITEYRGTPEMVVTDPAQLTSDAGGRSTAPGSSPVGVTAQCRDGTYSYSQTRRGTCSHHGGVAQWLQ